MSSEKAPTRQEVAKALRVLECWGRLGTASPPPAPPRADKLVARTAS